MKILKKWAVHLSRPMSCAPGGILIFKQIAQFFHANFVHFAHRQNS